MERINLADQFAQSEIRSIRNSLNSKFAQFEIRSIR